MPRHTMPPSGLTRRSAVAGLGAGGLGFALAAASRDVAATTMDTDGHPIVGSWFSETPLGPALSIYGADGTLAVVFAPTQAGQAGVTYTSTALGSWEPTSASAVRFTMIQVMSDAAGTYLGTVTIEGFPTVAEDGQTFTDTSPDSRITIRDAAHAQVAVLGGDGSTAPVTSMRVTPGGFNFLMATPASSTPAA